MKTDVAKLLSIDLYDFDSYYSSFYYLYAKWIIDSHRVKNVRIRGCSGPNVGKYGPE